MKAAAPLTLVLALAGCYPQTVRTVSAHQLDERTGTLWIVEVDSRPKHSDVLRVTVCHRDGRPACVRHIPPDLATMDEYAAWLATIPKVSRDPRRPDGASGDAE